MKNFYNRGITPIAIILIVAGVLAVAGGGYWWWYVKTCRGVSDNIVINKFICSNKFEKPQKAKLLKTNISGVDITFFDIAYGEDANVGGVEFKEKVYSYEEMKTADLRNADPLLFSTELVKFLKSSNKDDYHSYINALSKNPNLPPEIIYRLNY